MSITGFSLWCGMGGYSTFPTPDQEAAIVAFVEKCATFGVRRLLPTLTHDDYCVRFIDFDSPPAPVPTFGDYYRRWHPLRVLVQQAHARGIEVHPYLAINSSGGRLPRGSDSLMGELYPLAFTTRFAAEHPRYWRRDREGHDSFTARNETALSFAYSAVRDYQQAFLVQTIQAFDLDGIQLEFVAEPLDADENALYGYEQPIVQAFREQTGLDPFALDNGDERWVRHRANVMTQFIAELRAGLAALGRPIPLSISFGAAEMDRYIRKMVDWPTWVSRGLVDDVCLWYRGGDSKRFVRWTAAAAAAIGGRCQLTAELSVYHAETPRTDAVLVALGQASLGAGATGLGVYRGEAVEVYRLWKGVLELAKLPEM